jgi:hypothetical protein
VVQNPDRTPDHVVDLRQLQKVEAGEVNCRKCVSLYFTAKLQKSKEAVRFICMLLVLCIGRLFCTIIAGNARVIRRSSRARCISGSVAVEEAMTRFHFHNFMMIVASNAYIYTYCIKAQHVNLNTSH